MIFGTMAEDFSERTAMDARKYTVFCEDGLDECSEHACLDARSRRCRVKTHRDELGACLPEGKSSLYNQESCRCVRKARRDVHRARRSKRESSLY